MKYIYCLSSVVLVFFSCTSSSNLKENRILLKEYAFCKCFEYAELDTFYLKSDVGAAIYRDIANYYPDAFDVVDTFAMKMAKQILPSPIADHNGKKTVLKDCFIFFKSKQLDSLITTLDKRSFKE